MKTSITFFSIAVYLLLSTVSQAQWQQDLRLTNDPTVSQFAFVAVSGPVVHVVWQDNRDGNDEIYYKRSTNSGINWTADTRLTIDPAFSDFAFVAVSGSVVHVVWYDARDGNNEIYYKRSTNSGINWTADTRLTIDPAGSDIPSVAASGSDVHVVWRDTRDGNQEIYYKHSSDSGLTWEVDKRLTIDPAQSHFAFAAVSDSVVHVIWYDYRDGNWEIYYKRSTSGGLTWEVDTRLTNNPAGSHNSFIAASGDNVHVVWEDNRDGNWEIYYKCSTSGGLTWEVDTSLTNNPGSSRVASIAVSGSVLHVVWEDNRDGNSEIYYKRNPTGNPIGIININSEIPGRFKLEQNYPNPFNPNTKIKFDIPSDVKRETANVRLVIYDILGQEVAILVNEQLNPGTYEVEWDAGNFPSGVYYYRMTAGNYTETKRMALVK